MTGFFISFEGPDGVGKTTQLKLAAEYLRKRGSIVNCTREPGGTAAGNQIRDLLLNSAYGSICPRAEALLYMAARAQHVDEIIRPALGRGEIVLSDRYSDSTIVYQGIARKLAKSELEAINAFATGGLMPDLTILFDCGPDFLRQRMSCRGAKDRIEQEAQEFHESVRKGFLELAAAQTERIRLVDAAGSVDGVHRAVVAVLEEFLNRRISL